VNAVFDDRSPIYRQIAERVEADVLSGALRGDEQVMSTNKYAAFHRINPATVAKAFGQLGGIAGVPGLPKLAGEAQDIADLDPGRRRVAGAAHQADLPRHRRVLEHRSAADRDRAARGPPVAGEQRQQAGLAGAVAAQQPVDPAPGQREAHPVQRGDVLVPQGQPGRLDDAGHVGPSLMHPPHWTVGRFVR
jgi:DNA-binding transcriptional MocR family regulator